MIREPKIRDQNMAMDLAAKRAKDNPLLLVTNSQMELLKLLLVQVDGKDISGNDREQLDSLFNLGEYNQMLQVVGQLSGGKDLGELKIEL